MGRCHLEACGAAAGLRAVAVADPRPHVQAEVRASGLAAHPGVPELLSAGGFDAVVIAAPSDLHRELVGTLAAAGIPMLCEKPCGLSSDQALDAAAAAARAGVMLQIGYWRRFVPELRV